MRKLLVNKIPVALKPGHSVKLTRGNVLFDKKDSFSLPIEISMDVEQNRKAIKYLHNLQVSGNRGQAFDALLNVSGVPILQGQAVLKEIADRYTQLTLKGNSLDFWERAKELNMKTIGWPEIPAFHETGRTITGIISELMSTLSVHKPYVAFELYNQNFEDDTSTGRSRRLYNDWQFNAQQFSPATNGNGDPYTQYTVFFRVYAVMKKLFNICGFDVVENYFEDSTYLKNIAQLNLSDIWLMEGAVTWGNFMPNITVYDYLEKWKKSGISFDVDNVTMKVYIRKKNAHYTVPPKSISGLIANSVKQTIEKENGFIINMNRGADSYANTDLEDVFNDYDNVPPSVASATKEEMGAVGTLKDYHHYVTSEGLWYKPEDDGEGNWSWVLRTGKIQPKKSGDNEVEIDVEVYPAFTRTAEQVGNLFKWQQTTVNIGIETADDFKDVIITAYRGMYDGHGGDGTIAYPSYPHAHYLPVDAQGVTITGLSLDTSFFYNLVSDHLAFLQNSFKIELQFLGSLTDFLEFPFYPRLLKHQRLFIEAMTFACKDNQEEILYTLTGRVEQTDEVEGIEVGQLYEQVNLESQVIDLENDLFEL